MGKREVIPYDPGPPVIENRAGVVHVRYRGGDRAERTMSVKTLARSVERAQRALERYGRGEEDVVVDD